MSIEQISEVLSQQLEVLVKEYGAINFMERTGKLWVQLGNLKDLENIPGKAKYEERCSCEYPFQAFKTVGNVKYLTLISPNKARDIGLI